MKKGPLVTFFVMAYNQEKLVRDAILGAFSQTYLPLEIILSDDCSSDRTYEVMVEMAKQYSGEASIVLNRNSSNVGLCAHLNRIVELASGDWLIASAGDDVSVPTRTEEIVRCILDHQTAAYIVSQAYCFSGTVPADTSGLQVLRREIGATEAFRRSTFQRFGPLLPQTFSEDWALFFRGQLDGKVIFLEKPLVLYREAPGGLSQQFNVGALSRVIDVHEVNLLQFSEDLRSPAMLRENAISLGNEIRIRLAAIDSIRRSLSAVSARPKLALDFIMQSAFPLKQRLSMLAIILAPELFRFYERIRHSRLARFSPTQWALAFINPKSILIAPERVGT